MISPAALCLILAALCTAAGCQMPAPTGDQPLPLMTIGKGPHSAITESRRTIIENGSEWARFWADHTGGQESPAPEVDFSRERVLAATMGTRTSGGFSIEITSARTLGNRVVVEIHESVPAGNTMTAAVTTTPFHIVRIPNTRLPIEIRDGIQ